MNVLYIELLLPVCTLICYPYHVFLNSFRASTIENKAHIVGK